LGDGEAGTEIGTTPTCRVRFPKFEPLLLDAVVAVPLLVAATWMLFAVIRPLSSETFARVLCSFTVREVAPLVIVTVDWVVPAVPTGLMFNEPTEAIS